MRRYYYSNSVSNFILDDDNKILGELSFHHSYALEELQRNAWIEQIKILKDALQPFPMGKLYFEFSIPRMGKRVDNVFIIEDLIFVIEFKVGEYSYQNHHIEQVVDYCLDLKNFHEGSHHAKLIPLLISTKAPAVDNVYELSDNLFLPLRVNRQNIGKVILQSLSTGEYSKNLIDTAIWENSVYKPTPTIIEAAQALYRGHNVKEISRHDAGAINLSKTTDCLNRIIETSKVKNRKSICFLTGIPGAGKTLAGLNIANERMKADKEEHAVFLSGNGPLVEVLREALTRDALQFAKENGEQATKRKEKERAVKFIQNIHHFRDDNWGKKIAPVEKVGVFDEAQREWGKDKLSSFMKRKKNKDSDMSEPEFLISVMDRHNDWCTIICLVGGGQEINTGEAGVSEWLKSLQTKYSHWDIYFSKQILTGNGYIPDAELRDWLPLNGIEKPELHLAISVRSFRSEKISEFFQEVLGGNNEIAKQLLLEVGNDYPIFLTRNLETAKKWLRQKAKGSERIGIVASSGGRRLRPTGIDVKNQIAASNWFLNGNDDVRSSNYLEDVATEFDIQGLEIDYICLAWDINFYFSNGNWGFQRFEGTAWRQINSIIEKQYMLNTYRVLLTRARQGLIIFVPNGDDVDKTRPKNLYDSNYEYLISCGITEI